MKKRGQPYSQRPAWAHKGDFGYVLVIGGSAKYSGSPIFNGIAALRAGADVVTLVGPRRPMDIAAAYTPDLITVALPSDLRVAHMPRILKLAEKFDAAVLGGGMQRDAATFRAIRALIAKLSCPMVLDAEAIRAVAQEPKILYGKNILLTPNTIEFEMLTGETLTNNVASRKRAVVFWAKKFHTVILLKGHVDIIANAQRVATNHTGTPFMTKGGFGDILAGICGALLARGCAPFDAGCCAANISGIAGALAAKQFGEGTLASDALPLIPAAIAQYKG